MTFAEIMTLIGAAAPVLGGGGWWISRATVRAAQATAAANEAAARAAAEPAKRANEFAVLQATVTRVDVENDRLRARQSRLEALLRAFASTADRWASQMRKAGVEPEPVHPLVDEYNRTGV